MTREHVLFISNYTKLYRHSFYADYYVYNVAEKTTVPLVDDQTGGMLEYAIFVTSDSSPQQIFNMLPGDLAETPLLMLGGTTYTSGRTALPLRSPPTEDQMCLMPFLTGSMRKKSLEAIMQCGSLPMELNWPF